MLHVKIASQSRTDARSPIARRRRRQGRRLGRSSASAASACSPRCPPRPPTTSTKAQRPRSTPTCTCAKMRSRSTASRRGRPHPLRATDLGQRRRAARRPRSAVGARLRAPDTGHRQRSLRCAAQGAGVGQKTAERIVLDLRDKVQPPAAGVDGCPRGAAAGEQARDGDVMAALMGLGYSQTEAAESREAPAGRGAARGACADGPGVLRADVGGR